VYNTSHKISATAPLGTVKPPTFIGVGQSHVVLPWNNQQVTVLHTPQACANLLESMVWDADNDCLFPEFEGLPWIEVRHADEKFAASTLTLPHRIGSGWLANNSHTRLKDGRSTKELIEHTVKEKGFYQALIELDPLSAVFGCWMSHLDLRGVVRTARCINLSILAENAVSIAMGGAVHDPIATSGQHLGQDTGNEGETTRASESGIGNIPYQRDTVMAEKYTINTMITDAPLRGSKLKPEQRTMVLAIAQYIVAKALSQPLFLRSEAVLEVDKGELPQEWRDLDGLKKAMQKAIIAVYGDANDRRLVATLPANALNNAA
jgi:CRISPR-associated protein Csb1